MKITFDRYRILHLFLLMACTFILAETLIAKMDWSKLSAYGFACTVVTQISNAMNPIESDNSEPPAADKKKHEKRRRIVEKRRERRSGSKSTEGE
jgi:hypothetical protein